MNWFQVLSTVIVLLACVALIIQFMYSAFYMKCPICDNEAFEQSDIFREKDRVVISDSDSDSDLSDEDVSSK